MNKPLTVILVTVTLDAIGLGLILPILPALLREVSHQTEVAVHFGLLWACYALMQFLFSPVLGVLSDRFGRRPVLLMSLAGACVDYLVMAFAASLWILYVGRIVAGITGANMTVATAYIADITPEDQRAKRYGFMHACFGLGFIAGPALGGLLGDLSPRYPFLAAAAMNGLNFLLGCFVLPESRRTEAKKVEVKHLNPLRPLRHVWLLGGIGALLTIYIVMSMVGQVPMALWVIYCEEKFAWGAAMVGLSFAVFGLLHAVAQAFMTGWITKKLGEFGAIVFGILADATGYLLMAFATAGWVVFPIIPFLCLGGIAMPALQSLLSQRVSEEHQGELQGTLVSLTSLVTIFGPPIATTLHSYVANPQVGYVWIAAAALYLISVPALRQLRQSRPVERRSPELTSVTNG